MVVTRGNAWDLPLTLLPFGHAGKCLGPPLDPITLWSRGEMPGTSLSPYYPLVTRENAWDLPPTLLPFGHAGKCLGPPPDPIAHWIRGKMPGTSPWPYCPLVTRGNALGLPMTLLPIGNAAKCLGPSSQNERNIISMQLVQKVQVVLLQNGTSV